MKKSKMLLVVVIVLIVFALSACVTANPMKDVPLQETGKVYGFWNGLWDGFIVEFNFVFSLFNKNYDIYQVHNNGGWYNFGYLLGVSITFGSVATGNKLRRSN